MLDIVTQTQGEMSRSIKAAKAIVVKLDHAENKAEQYRITLGQHLKTIKELSPDQATFLQIVQEQVGLGKTRTYELLQIADGTRTVEEVRDAGAERKARERAKLSVMSRTETDDDSPPFLDRTAPKLERGKTRTLSGLVPSRHPKQSDDDMPTQEEADESYQQTLYDHVCLSVDREMSGETRQRFFAYLKRKYHVDYSQSPAQRGDKGLPA